MEEFVSIFLTAIVPALVGLLVWTVKEVRKARVEASRAASTTERGILMLTRQGIVAANRAMLSKGELTYAERDSFREMHALYAELGGNGAVGHTLRDLDKVKVVPN